jgi:hypothetical protein
MDRALARFVGEGLAAPVPDEARAFAERLAKPPAAAVLFYGSALRTGDLEGVLDFYVLTDRPHRRGLRGLVERRLWPEVSYHEASFGGREVRAKVATMTIETFLEAARGERLDTTIWARFVQPCALAWSRDPQAAETAAEAVAQAAITATRFAAALGPPSGPARAYWKVLFRQTYAAEFRVETPGREDQVLAFHPGRYEALLPLGWRAGGLAFSEEDGVLWPRLGDAELAGLRRAWRARRRMGKPLNVARLVKAAFTFEGASRYAAWKLERHTGFKAPLTPWRERHPILAAPGVLWRLGRARRRRQADAR